MHHTLIQNESTRDGVWVIPPEQVLSSSPSHVALSMLELCSPFTTLCFQRDFTNNNNKWLLNNFSVHEAMQQEIQNGSHRSSSHFTC